MEVDFKPKHIPLIVIAVISGLSIFFSLNSGLQAEDEVLYIEVAEILSKGEYPAYFRKVVPRTLIYPPGMPLIFAPFFRIFGVSLTIAKLITTIFGIMTILMVYLISIKIVPMNYWKDNEFFSVASLSSVAVLISIPLFYLYMFIVYVDIPIAFFSALCTYLFMTLNSKKRAITTGVAMGIAFYIKSSALLFPVFLVIYGLYKFFVKQDKEFLKLVVISCIVAGLIYLPWIVRNLVYFGYPYFDPLNPLFEQPSEIATASWITDAFKVISPGINIWGTFGQISIILGIFGVIYFLLSRDDKIILPIIFLVIFSAVFFLISLTRIIVLEARYTAMIFPQIAILSGFFLSKLYESDKYFIVIILVIVALSFYNAYELGVFSTQITRWPQDYIWALEYIKEQAKNETVGVFTAYGGSVKYYSGQENVWGIDEFPELMTTRDGERIYNVLKENNVTYILIWRGIVAERYIIPESNLIGAFTPSFIETVGNDKTHFQLEFSNENNAVYKLKGLE